MSTNHTYDPPGRDTSKIDKADGSGVLCPAGIPSWSQEGCGGNRRKYVPRRRDDGKRAGLNASLYAGELDELTEHRAELCYAGAPKSWNGHANPPAADRLGRSPSSGSSASSNGENGCVFRRWLDARLVERSGL